MSRKVSEVFCNKIGRHCACSFNADWCNVFTKWKHCTRAYLNEINTGPAPCWIDILVGFMHSCWQWLLAKCNHSAGRWRNCSADWVGQRTTVSGQLRGSRRLRAKVDMRQLAELTDDVRDPARLIDLLQKLTTKLTNILLFRLYTTVIDIWDCRRRVQPSGTLPRLYICPCHMV